MRTTSALALLMLIASMVIAQDKPKDKATEIEKRIGELEKEADRLKEELAKLRKELDELRGIKRPVLWQIEMTSDLKGSAAVADVDGDDKLEVVFGSYYYDEHIYCVEAATGVVKWRHKSDGGPLDASISIADLDGDGKPEILGADSAWGKLYVLTGKGNVKGTIPLPSGTDSPCAIADLDGDAQPEIVVGTMWKGREGKGWVCCYRGDTHELKWKRELKGCIQSEPCLVDLNGDKVLDAVVTSWRGDRNVTAVNGKDSEVLWTFATAGNDKSMGMYHGVALGGGEKPSIYVATCDGDVYAIDFKGNKVWNKHFDDYLFALITVVSDGNSGENLVLGGRNLYLLAAKDGAERWKRDLGKSLDRGVAVCDADGDGDDDFLYADGKALVARDPKTGDETFRFEAGFGKGKWEEISSGPIVADFDGDGLLEAFLVCGEGTSEDRAKNNYGRAMAVRLRGKALPWKTFRGNLRRTGNAASRD